MGAVFPLASTFYVAANCGTAKKLPRGDEFGCRLGKVCRKKGVGNLPGPVDVYPVLPERNILPSSSMLGNKVQRGPGTWVACPLDPGKHVNVVTSLDFQPFPRSIPFPTSVF
jgi:hypothetical protein